MVKGPYRKIPIQSAKLNWKDLHPAPVGSKVVVEDKNCCECIFFDPSNHIMVDQGRCNLHNKPTNNYDECSAFTKKSPDSEKTK